MGNERSSRLTIVGENKVLPFALTSASQQALEKVLGYLQKNDDLFDYNVPSKWRVSDADGLQQYLVKTYKQSNFEIVGEENVKKYIRPYDFVAFDEPRPGFMYDYYIEPGMTGVIASVDYNSAEPIFVRWDSCYECSNSDVVRHTGEGLILHSNSFFRKKKITDLGQLLKEAKPGAVLEATKLNFKYSCFVPVGTKGIVTNINDSSDYPVGVVFGNTEGYIPLKGGVIDVRYHSLKLLRENKIDIKKVIHEMSH